MGNPDWKNTLAAAATDKAAGRIMGWQSIEHAGHAQLVTAALAAFGDDPRGLFVVEVSPPAGAVPRPDLVLCHPEVGCLVVECKGVPLPADTLFDNAFWSLFVFCQQVLCVVPRLRRCRSREQPRLRLHPDVRSLRRRVAGTPERAADVKTSAVAPSQKP
ncbi:MAG: hypothetical protein ACFCVE_12120 [Phycisphaerae bacterium]